MNDYLCNLIVPGFPKSGTSSFHEYLDQHPSICMSRPKECHYFARSQNWSRGKDFHNSLFEHRIGDELWYGESSTVHCAWEDAIRRTAENLCDPRIIFVLRHPVFRTVSHYRWLFALGIEHRPFLQAISEDGDTFHPDDDIMGMFMGYLLFSRYSVHVPKWIEVHGSNKVLLVSSEMLQNSASLVMNNVWHFLDLPSATDLVERQDNRSEDKKPLLGPRAISRMAKCLMPDPMLGWIRRRRTVHSFLHSISTKPLRASTTSIPVVTIEEREHVAKLLKDDIKFFEAEFPRDSKQNI